VDVREVEPGTEREPHHEARSGPQLARAHGVRREGERHEVGDGDRLEGERQHDPGERRDEGACEHEAQRYRVVGAALAAAGPRARPGGARTTGAEREGPSGLRPPPATTGCRDGVVVSARTNPPASALAVRTDLREPRSPRCWRYTWRAPVTRTSVRVPRPAQANGRKASFLTRRCQPGADLRERAKPQVSEERSAENLSALSGGWRRVGADAPTRGRYRRVSSRASASGRLKQSRVAGPVVRRRARDAGRFAARECADRTIDT
jgi:hypothetical protein